MKRRNPRTRNLRKALRIESLESRQLMAGLTTNFDREARTLTITGSDTADVVSITQNDSANRIGGGTVTGGRRRQGTFAGTNHGPLRCCHTR